MKQEIPEPKVFISYSWTPEENKEKVLELAEKLRGIHVVMDVYDLKEGQDKYKFMEKMVNDQEITRVLIICNKDYKEKADDRKGGVGTESLIISDEIYKSAEQKKFIPVVFEKDDNNKPYFPAFLKTRIYIDLSNEDVYEEELEKLIRNIFNKPLIKRPQKTLPPSYILENDQVYIKTSHIVKTIKNALINEKKNFQIFIDEYYDIFIDSLKDYILKNEEIPSNIDIDEPILKKINELIFLRDGYINFLEVVLKYSTQIDIEKLHRFLERLIEFFESSNANKYDRNVHGSLKYDQFRFFFYEIFIYTAAIMWKKEKFKELGFLLHNSYINIVDQHTKVHTYSFFSSNINSLDKFRNKRLNGNRKSIMADTILSRANNPNYSFDFLKDIDITLYFISLMIKDSENIYDWGWWPRLSVYDTFNVSTLSVLISKRKFDKIKPVFNVDSVVDLEEKVKYIIDNKIDSITRYKYIFPQISSVFKIGEVGSID